LTAEGVPPLWAFNDQRDDLIFIEDGFDELRAYPNTDLTIGTRRAN
jgi:hypothetical protein